MNALDLGLLRVHETDPQWGLHGEPGELANHAPMAAEALDALGRADAIPAFLDRYLPLLQPLRAGKVLTREERALARGQTSRIGDWVATFEHDIAEHGPHDVVAREIGDLMPGLMAGALHGLLRVAHAYRGLSRSDSPARRRELAHGLAYWAGAYQELPPLPRERSADTDLGAVLARVPLVPAAQRGGDFIADRVKNVGHAQGFGLAMASCDPGLLSLDDYVNQVHAFFAPRVALPSPARFTYLHVLTSHSCLRELAPTLTDAQRKLAQRLAFQAAAALYATHEPHAGFANLEVPDGAPSVEDAVDRAVKSLDDHSIKLADALVRERSGPNARALSWAVTEFSKGRQR